MESGHPFVVSFLLLGRSYGGSAPSGSHVQWTRAKLICCKTNGLSGSIVNINLRDFTVPVPNIDIRFIFMWSTVMCRLGSFCKAFLLLHPSLPPSLPPSLISLSFPFLLSPSLSSQQIKPRVPVLRVFWSLSYSHVSNNLQPPNSFLSQTYVKSTYSGTSLIWTPLEPK